MKHTAAITRLPARAADNYADPADDGFISLPELMYMTLQAVQALASYLMAKETWGETH
jgi:hypothetical protein